MGKSYETGRKNKQMPVNESGPQEESLDVRRQIAKATETEQFNDRDPIWHIDESFCQHFDMAGMRRAKASDEKEGKIKSEGEKDDDNGERGESDPREDSKTDFTSEYEKRKDENEPDVGKFAETAFKRGQLSSAVIAGTGKSMFFSCLNRSVGQERARKRKERRLFQAESRHRKMPGNEGAKLIVNRGEAESAVGLVVDSLKDARWTLKSMQEVAEGKMGPDGAKTYRKEYPFLTDDKERETLKDYKERLKNSSSDKEKQALQAGIVKLEHIIEKKNQMKRRFLDHLKKLQHDALLAESMFLSESFLEGAFENETEISSDDGSDDGGNGDPPDMEQ